MDIFVNIVHSICREAHRLSKRATTHVLRAISKHSAQYSQAIVDQGGVELIIPVLLEFDPAVKEIAAGTIGNIARHTPALAQITVDRGAVESLVDLINVCFGEDIQLLPRLYLRHYLHIIRT